MHHEMVVLRSVSIMKAFDMKSPIRNVAVRCGGVSQTESQSRSLPGVLAFYDSHSGRE